MCFFLSRKFLGNVFSRRVLIIGVHYTFTVMRIQPKSFEVVSTIKYKKVESLKLSTKNCHFVDVPYYTKVRFLIQIEYWSCSLDFSLASYLVGQSQSQSGKTIQNTQIENTQNKNNNRLELKIKNIFTNVKLFSGRYKLHLPDNVTLCHSVVVFLGHPVCYIKTPRCGRNG